MTITIHGQTPSLKNRKKITCKGNRPRMYTEKSVKDWQKDALQELMQYTGQQDGKVMMDYMFYVKDDAVRDISNMIQSVEDILVEKGLLIDDSWQHVCIGTADAQIDRDNPRCEVTIVELE